MRVVVVVVGGRVAGEERTTNTVRPGVRVHERLCVNGVIHARVYGSTGYGTGGVVWKGSRFERRSRKLKLETLD